MESPTRNAAGMPAIVFMLAWFAVQRDRHSPEWCEKKQVGPMRDVLAKALTNFGDVSVLREQRSLASCISVGVDALAVHCSLCGKCPRSGRA